ncbi:hypothetical protein HYS30_02055 [Candidatus Peregrinibacteria bacterium]|nr:hypothetical protein [Candidatus Peregrinibacteria bacterium]
MTQCETSVHENPLPSASGSPKRTPTTQIARGRFGTVSALILALGATLPADKPEAHSPTSDPSSSHRALLSVPEKAHVRAPEEVTVEDFRIEGATFTCRFGERDIRGALDKDGGIQTVHFDDITMTLTSPISPLTLERFLRNATESAALLTARGIAPRNGTMEALGGARFLFTTGTGEKTQHLLATARDILTIDPADEDRRVIAVTEWLEALHRLAPLSQAQQDTISARIEIHNGRMRLVYDNLTWRTQHENGYYWHQRRDEFVNEWNALSAQWKDASLDARGTLLSRFHVSLDAWERWLSMTSEMESEEVFQERYQKLLQELQRCREQEPLLRNRAHTRHLTDAARGITVVEQSTPLSQKNFTREELSSSGLLLRRQLYEDDVLAKETEYDPSGNAAKETIFQYFPGGQRRRAQENTPKDGKMTLQRQTDYWRNGNVHAVLDVRSDAFAYFGEGGNLLYEDVARSNRAKRERGMVDAQGNRFGLYQDEKVKNPTLTTGQYLDMLARKLDTEEKIAVFFEQFLWYAYDNGDYWQTAEETVLRIEENSQSGARYMRGDCDDYAFLARDILRRQGKNAHVVLIPQHAICVWIERDAEGKFHAKSQDTFGFDHNGNRYGRDHSRDRERTRGFATLMDALNSLMKKYRYPGLGLQEGQDYTLHENAITILPNPPAGNYQLVTADYFLQKVP